LDEFKLIARDIIFTSGSEGHQWHFTVLYKLLLSFQDANVKLIRELRAEIIRLQTMLSEHWVQITTTYIV